MSYQKTPDSILNEFYRYKRAEKSRRNGAFGLNFDADEGRRFAEQIQILKGLEGQCPDQAFVPLSTEVHFPEELSEEQLLYYYSRKPYFARNAIQEGEEYYGRLYLLELANGIHHSDDETALTAVFQFYDSMDQFGTDPDYLLRLCISFLIAHSDMAKSIRTGLIERDLYWKYDLIGDIRQGRFQRAGLFVQRYARLLKPEEISGDKPFIKATWQAMPEVFTCLDRTFGDHSGHLFRKFLTAGEESSTEVEILPVRRRAFGQKRRIALSDTCYLDSRPTYGSARREQWVRTEWVLKEGAQDFLYVIHLYAESFVREYYRAPKRKRTADRFLKKKYARTGDDASVIRAMKEVMRDARFEQAIGDGVACYMKEHPAPVQEGKVSPARHAQILYQMDHEQLKIQPAVDYERFRQARSDAESVLSMLHHEEIDYNRVETEGQGETFRKDSEPVESAETGVHQEIHQEKKEEGAEGEGTSEQLLEREQAAVPFSLDESRYLTYLLGGEPEKAEQYIQLSGLSVNLLMKQINKKALQLWDDVLLEREGTNVVIVEDYIKELKDILS